MITLNDQMETQVIGPVILINKFNVKYYEVEQFLKAWEEDATKFKNQTALFLHSYIKSRVSNMIFILMSPYQFF